MQTKEDSVGFSLPPCPSDLTRPVGLRESNEKRGGGAPDPGLPENGQRRASPLLLPPHRRDRSHGALRFRLGSQHRHRRRKLELGRRRRRRGSFHDNPRGRRRRHGRVAEPPRRGPGGDAAAGYESSVKEGLQGESGFKGLRDKDSRPLLFSSITFILYPLPFSFNLCPLSCGSAAGTLLAPLRLKPVIAPWAWAIMQS